MSTLGFRAVWAMGERVGYGKTKFSFSVTAAAKIDLTGGVGGGLPSVFTRAEHRVRRITSMITKYIFSVI